MDKDGKMINIDEGCNSAEALIELAQNFSEIGDQLYS